MYFNFYNILNFKYLFYLDNYEVCGLHNNIFSSGGIEVAYPDDCRTLDRRSGLTFFKYLHPVNFSQPDLVSSI